MTKENTNPAEEIKEETAAVDAVEEAAADDEQVTVPANETAPEEAPASEDAEDKADSEDADAPAAEEDEEKTVILDEADQEAVSEPETETAPAKKPLSFGMGLGIGIGIAVLVAAIIGVIMLISASSDPASAVDEYINAYKNADYEDYFSRDYSVMFKYNNLDESVQQAQQYGDASSAEELETKVISTVTLSAEVKDTITSQLEGAEYNDVDKIEDICIVLLEISRPSEADETRRDYWVSSFYAVKVDGEWYFATGF